MFEGGSHPSDPTGSLLQGIMNEAANRWSDVVEDTHTMTIRFFYGTHATAAAGIDSPNAGDNMKVHTGNIIFSDDRAWYYDPSPANDLEFTFSQSLYQNALASDFTLSGTAEPLLEVGYRGTANGTDPAAALGFDILSTALHEIGHLMGLHSQLLANDNETADGDYDLPPTLLAGAGMGAKILGTGDPGNAQSHLKNVFPLMSGVGTGTGIRRMISATDVLAAASISGWSQIDLDRQDFLTSGVRNFKVASNWEGNSEPDSQDAAFIRNGAQVFINGVTDVVNSLNIENTSEFGVAGGLFIVSTTTMIHENTTSGVTRIYVNSGAELQTNFLEIQGGKLVVLGGLVDVNDIAMTNTSNSVATVSGSGTVDVQVELTSAGSQITATGNDTLTFDSANPSVVVDLGDFFNSTDVTANAGNVVFNTGITTDFWGTMTVGADRHITVNKPWTIAGGGDLVMNGGATLATAAELRGSAVEILGSVTVDKEAVITAPVTFNPHGYVTVPDADDVLTFNANVTYNGGSNVYGGRGRFVYNAGADMQAGEIVVAFLDLGTAGAFDMQGGEVTVDTISPGSGTFTLNGGTLHVDQFNGDLDNLGGTLAPGSSFGTTQNAGGTLEIEIGGTLSGQFDVLDVGVSATLAGTLDVILIGGFLPALGNSFPIITGSIGGTFATTEGDLPALADGLAWDIDYLASSVLLNVVAGPLLGDYNQNGIVDGADYVVWRKNPGDYGGDPDGYNTWRTNFGQTAGSGSGANANPAVPEPTTLLMLIVAAVGMRLRRRHFA